MPTFLSRSQVYQLISAELPPNNVYPESGTPSGFFATSDSDATAAVISDYYEAQEVTYNNYFPISSTGSNGRFPDHQIAWLGAPLPSSLTVAQQLAAFLAAVRRPRAPTLWNILTLALTFVPQGVVIGIYPFNQQGGAASWQLDVSELGVTTYLGYSETDPTEAALNAFGYQVIIFGYTLTAMEYTALDLALQAQEPARSYHVILQNQSLPAYQLNYLIPDINAYNLVNVAFVDPIDAPDTGYSGYQMEPTGEQFALTDQLGNILITQTGDELVTQI